jgi:hypothetical protein
VVKRKIFDDVPLDECYEIVDLGYCNADYFQGFETSFTPFDSSVYGIGSCFSEAFEDALFQAWMCVESDFEVKIMTFIKNNEEISKVDDSIPWVEKGEEEEYEDTYYHVGIRWMSYSPNEREQYARICN